LSWADGPLAWCPNDPKHVPTVHSAKLRSRRDSSDAFPTESDVLMPMNRTDLVALASPPCHDCGAPVQRVEMPWHLDEDYNWRAGPYFMVCTDGHRVLVEALA
jgi:hypothetical protein